MAIGRGPEVGFGRAGSGDRGMSGWPWLDPTRHPYDTGVRREIASWDGWAKALVSLNAQNLDQKTLETTLSVLLKHETDLQRVKNEMNRPTERTRFDDEMGRYRRLN